MRRLNRARQVAVELCTGLQLVTQAKARCVIPSAFIQLLVGIWPGYFDFALGIDQCQTTGQPEIRRQLQVVADMQYVIRALVDISAHQCANRIGDRGLSPVRRPHFIRRFFRVAAGQVGGGAPANGGVRIQPKQLVLTRVVEGGTDVAVVHPNTIRALHQIHRVVVIDQPHFQRTDVVQTQRGLVRQPSATRLLAFCIAGNVGGIGLGWVIIDLRLGQTTRRLVFGFTVTQVKAGL